MEFDPLILASFAHCIFEKEAEEWTYLFEFLKDKKPGVTGTHPIKYAACCNTILTYRGKKGYYDHGKAETVSITALFDKGEINRDIFFELLKEAKMDRSNKAIYPAYNLPHFTYNLQQRYKYEEEEKDSGAEEVFLFGKPKKRLVVEVTKEMKEMSIVERNEEKGREVSIQLSNFLSNRSKETSKN